MTATAETADSPIQTATAQGGNSFSTPTTTTLPLAQGAAGTFQTLDAMARCVKGEVAPHFCGYKSLWIRHQVRVIAWGLNSWEQIPALFNFVAHQIKYELHPIDQQVVQDACQTIRLKTGDCVSKSVLLATLLASLDYPVKFIAQYFNDNQQYSHVYVLTQDENGNEIRLDPVASDQPMGWSQKLPDGGFETSYDIFN